MSLSERVERAEGPSRELDAEIAVAVKLGCRPNLPDDLEHLSLPNKRNPGPGVLAGHYWFHCRSGMSLRSADAYTSSLDAAATLASPHWSLCANGDKPGWQAMDFAGGKVWCNGATPALALCGAALRARGL